MKTIAFLNELNQKNTQLAGGKGAALGELTQAGWPIPPGFVVLTDAFRAHLVDNQLSNQINDLLENADITNGSSLDSTAREIQRLIIDAGIGDRLSTQVLEAFGRLETSFVAVRSSATAEDSITASWAGELESYLYTDKDSLLANIKHCWASLFSPRAIVYRHEQGLLEADVAVAVVVQAMIPSEVSGICFTVHPVTKDPNQLIIEAGWGLGEAIVGGMVTPDSYVVDKTTSQLLECEISDQTEQILAKAGGGTATVAVAREKVSQQKLKPGQIEELTNLAVRVERHFGKPQDIEWAIANNKLWLLQSRPITTL